MRTPDKKYCSPNILPTSNYTCFTLHELHTIANTYNDYIQRGGGICKSKNSCVYGNSLIKLTNDKKKLWKRIYKRFSNICEQESCWIELNFIKLIKNKSLHDKLRYLTFKPKMARYRYEWLTTTDINKVLKQYEKANPQFKFLGALPCDFYKYQNVDYAQIKKFNKYGIVFNLDTADKDGSHWVAFFIDNIEKTVEYFDSVGYPPNKYISKFIKKILNIVPDYTYLENTIVHQMKNTECGVYSIHFIIQRVLGHSFYEITSTIINDNQMNKFRDFIFRPYS